MKIRSPRWRVGLMVVLGVCMVLVAVIYIGTRAAAEQYRSYTSPDGRFKVVVFRIPSLFAMPGQSGDASGFVRLIETRTGRVLQERGVDMVQSVDQMDWSSDSVHIKLFADWALPR